NPKVFASECQLFGCGGGGGGGWPAGTYVTSINNFGVCDNICVGEAVEWVFRSTSQLNSTELTSATLSGLPTCGYPIVLGTAPCTGANWTGMHRVSTYRAVS